MRQESIDIPRDKIADFCRRNHISKLALFGSVLRSDFRPDSDIDVLVEFEPGIQGSGLGTYFGLKDELEALFARPVDLVMPSAVRNPYVRAEIDRSREVVYAA